jgi:hypothetical protein
MLQAIDVVNEAIDDNTNKVRTSGNDWYTTFGDSTYIMSAFQFARKYTTLYGETQIKLYYNDYSTSTAKKADGIVRLVTPIFEAGYLDGIGMQEHDANQSPTAADWIATYNKFYPICNEMSVTEFDVATGSASPSASVLGTQANQYGQLFKCFVERSYLSGRGKIRVVTKDGLNDTYTFQTNQSSSLWNGQDQCKPAFYAVANVGKNFNELDSLLKYADTLKSVEYTSGSWTHLAAIRTLAKNAQTANYSASSSAADTLGAARDSLLAAIQGLVKAPSDVRRNANDAPKTYALGQNYPNPFNPTTRISYSVPQSGYISLKVYNVLGKEVAVLFEGMRKAGSYVATFNGTGLASGVYFYRLQTNNYTDVKKLVLMK